MNNDNPEQNPEVSKKEMDAKEVKRDFQGLIASTKTFLKDLLDIRVNTDADATKESIIADIQFKGHTSWILICSIFIASIGLNANSTAVVIGAMLISPLMGPILGMGLSLAINDIDTLRRSLKNFAVMVILSVVTAYLFFVFFPLRDESSELLARTQPDIRDVLIAFFGGLALIIARAKKGTIASVIFGVAIATALMPPLCTVGFGLAIGRWDFAGGALYLFIINTLFIGLATFLVIKVLKFPMVRYANSQRRRSIARIASLVALVVMIFPMITFYTVYKKSLFERDAKQFITQKIETFQFTGGGRFLNNLTEIDYVDQENSTIELVFMGNDVIADNIVSTWKAQKNEFPELKNTELRIIQGAKNEELDQMKYVSELYESKKAELLNKDERIQVLEAELAKLSKASAKQIPFADITQEAQANYTNLATLSFGYKITSDFVKTDTIPVFEINWKEGVTEDVKLIDSQRLSQWLKVRLKDSTIRVVPARRD